MRLKNILIKITAIVVVVFAVTSCDDDLNTVGSEIIGGVNFEGNQYAAIPVANTKKFFRVQTSGLPNNLLGVYEDPIYGQSIYNILSQIRPETFDPKFGDNAVLDSVVLNLPYFSTVTDAATADKPSTEYALDSIYGNSPYKLSIYQSNYFLRDIDPDSGARQLYYSNDVNDFDTEAKGTILAEIESFVPSNEEVILTIPDGDDVGTERDVLRLAPRLRVKFSEDIVDYFKDRILGMEGSPELSNENNFYNYFRGIYFKTEPINNNGNLLFLDLSNSDAQITLYYSFDRVDTTDEDEDGDTTDIVRGNDEFDFTFANNRVNSIENTITDPDIIAELGPDDQGTITGEENLYLRGGQGAVATIDFFSRYIELDGNNNPILDGDGNPIFLENPNDVENKISELDYLKNQEWLINEASIKLYINQDKVTSGDSEPERIYIFSLETGQVLVDYVADGPGNTTTPVNSFPNHIQRITRDSDDKGEFYKIRLTNHVISILNGNTDNVKLGVSVSQNVNVTTNASGFNIPEVIGNPDSMEDEIIPVSSILSHEGTILHGYGDTVPEGKRLKLDIFYTASKNN